MSTMHITPPPLSDHAMADLLCTIMILCRGNTPTGSPFWAYMCIKPSMAQAFKEARERGAFALGDFGTLIESGEDIDPPLEIQQRMERDFGMNHHFEQDILNAIEAEKRKYSS